MSKNADVQEEMEKYHSAFYIILMEIESLTTFSLWKMMKIQNKEKIKIFMLCIAF